MNTGPEKLEAALKAVQNNEMSIQTATAVFGISKIALADPNAGVHPDLLVEHFLLFLAEAEWEV